MAMKAVATSALLAGLAVAHSGVWNIEVDGIKYPAFDTRIDGKLGAKRVEWSFKDAGVPWAPIEKVSDPSLACGVDPKPPLLKAIARAGANVTVEWSGIIRTHYGPRMSYLAYLPEPNAKPSTLSWFKILGRGYDAKAKLWANEELIKSDRKDTFQLPSDIKPGMYILRTELVSLHYATRTGAQFYPHCFNIEIRGPGTATPEGVKIPGAYSAKDPYLAFELYTKNNRENNWEGYKVPGPAKYAGKYDGPAGPAPVVTEAERGVFPAAFQAKYVAFKKKEDREGLAFNQKLNDAQMDLKHKKVDRQNEAKLMPIFGEHIRAQQTFQKELQGLRKEVIQLGIAV